MNYSGPTLTGRPCGDHAISYSVGSRVERSGRVLLGSTIPMDWGKPRVTTSSRRSPYAYKASDEIEMCSRVAKKQNAGKDMVVVCLKAYREIPRQSVRTSGSSTLTNAVKPGIHLDKIQKLSSAHTSQRTPRPVNAVWRNTHYLPWESYETHKHTVLAKCNFLILQRVAHIVTIGLLKS